MTRLPPVPSSVTAFRLLVCATVAALACAGLDALGGADPGARPAPADALAPVAADPSPGGAESSFLPAQPTARAVPRLPGGGTRVFGHQRFLVAYYGTAGTGVLGVLGEGAPDTMHERLVRAAEPFGREGERVQPVYELIVTVADAVPGPDGDYSHDISTGSVREYIDAAHRNGALVVLDVQPGRSDFLTVVKRWTWALKDPWVGLALDPEWRVGPRQVPGQLIGSVGAAEVNRVSAWLSNLVERRRLPEKAFVLHQFRTSMIRDIARVRERAGLATVQHVDGFGTRSQKLATYHAVARPAQFAMGLKLFYDEDTNLFAPHRVRKIRPPVSFVSYQ